MDDFKITIFRDMKKSRGSAVLLTVLMLLVMMTMMIFYNSRVTTYEQRISGNDSRAKQAHHAAEAGVSHAMRYFKQNRNSLTRTTAGGWMHVDSSHWTLCTAGDTGLPCGSVPLDADNRTGAFNRENVYYYTFGGSSDLPLTPIIDEFSGDDYVVQALICVVDFDPDLYDVTDTATWAACDASGTSESESLAIKIIATGVSDDGTGEQIVEKMIANVLPGSGGPGVPLTVTSNINATGTVSIITNPDGGGLGVPISIWSENDVDFQSIGSSSTCEFGDYLAKRDSSFWRTHTFAESGNTVTVCDSCTCPDLSSDGALSHTASGGFPAREYFDIVDNDPAYPADLFEYYFGIPREEWETVRDSADYIVDDCLTVNETYSGLVWVDGYCDFPSNTTVGSMDNPVVLITPDGVKFNSNTLFYGLLFVTDPRVPPEEQSPDTIPTQLNGGPVIYGAILTDPGASPFNGGYTLVFLDELLDGISGVFLLGYLPRSWTDLIESS